jgi:hypothetical protein
MKKNFIAFMLAGFMMLVSCAPATSEASIPPGYEQISDIAFPEYHAFADSSSVFLLHNLPEVPAEVCILSSGYDNSHSTGIYSKGQYRNKLPDRYLEDYRYNHQTSRQGRAPNLSRYIENLCGRNLSRQPYLCESKVPTGQSFRRWKSLEKSIALHYRSTPGLSHCYHYYC